MNKGHWYGLSAYGVWGLLPIYWKWLQLVPTTQLIGHRVVWSFLSLLAVMLWSRSGRGFIQAVFHPRVLLIYALASGLITTNWLLYVWAVNAGFIVETSLGYFINPLISIVLGVLFLHERLRPGQWISVGLAALGIFYLTIAHGSVPWIALTLAFSWAFYGLVKKISPLESLEGLTLETGILIGPALAYLLYAQRIGQGAFFHQGITTDFLLIGAGLLTTIPLWMFATAVRSTPLFIMGLLQYIAPTISFLLGTLLYREPFTATQLIGFGLVWSALLLLGIEGYMAGRSLRRSGNFLYPDQSTKEQQ
ncbi:MAG TPA: EamA family transporter RarD [Thermodesulfobacteriota bacterium]|nr:EamA family transporter RarD [Thermodesulfobacteriota bacterium]